MDTEIEVKFLNIDHEIMRERLRAAGALCAVPMRLMRRAIIDYPDGRLQKGNENSFLRVRDEGDKVTLTYKKFESLSLSGAAEIQLNVDSFENAVRLLEAAGLELKSFQESKRETWSLGDVEIVLDEWPWLTPYMEIEGPTEESLRQAASTLGLAWDEAVFGDVMVAYRADYPHLGKEETISSLREVRFGAERPALLAVSTPSA